MTEALSNLKCTKLTETKFSYGVAWEMNLTFEGATILVSNDGRGGVNRYRGDPNLLTRLERQCRLEIGERHSLATLLSNMAEGDNGAEALEKWHGFSAQELLRQNRLEFR